MINQTICRAVVIAYSPFAGELWQDLLGDLLAIFHAPLIVAVDIPHHALHEYFVFIERN